MMLGRLCWPCHSQCSNVLSFLSPPRKPTSSPTSFLASVADLQPAPATTKVQPTCAKTAAAAEAEAKLKKSKAKPLAKTLVGPKRVPSDRPRPAKAALPPKTVTAKGVGAIGALVDEVNNAKGKAVAKGGFDAAVPKGPDGEAQTAKVPPPSPAKASSHAAGGEGNGSETTEELPLSLIAAEIGGDGDESPPPPPIENE